MLAFMSVHVPYSDRHDPALPTPVPAFDSTWDGRCNPLPGYCPAAPLRALVDKYPIRWCTYDLGAGRWTSHSDDVYAALTDVWGWGLELQGLGVELMNACGPWQLVNVWITEGYLGDPGPAAVTTYQGWHWAGDMKWTAEQCTIIINTAATTDVTKAIYWDQMTTAQRRSMVSHEFGHCLGEGHEDGGVMSIDYAHERPTQQNRETLRARYPYEDPLWFKWLKDHEE
jgi:hypothetical protein